jgi:hypothetical protein
MKLGERKNTCTILAIHLIRGHHCRRAVKRAAERVLVYSDYIATYLQGLYNTVWVLDGGPYVWRDSSDPKDASTLRYKLSKIDGA